MKSNKIKVFGAFLTLAMMLVIVLPEGAKAASFGLSIYDNEFSDTYLSVPVDSTVTWTNVGQNRHSVIADDGSFDSGNLDHGDSFSRTFRTEGTYDYYDEFYGSSSSGMHATIVVGDGSNGSTSYPRCSPSSQNADVGERVTFTARSGDGGYSWRAPDGSPSSGTGSRFSTTFDFPGSQTVTVRSNGRSDECTVEVRDRNNNNSDGSITTGAAPFCSPSTQTAQVNDFVSFSASGGNGTFYWIAADGNASTGSGQSFGTRFTTNGTKTVVLTSNGQNSLCLVQVTGGQVLGISDVSTGPEDVALWAVAFGLLASMVAFGVVLRKRLV